MSDDKSQLLTRKRDLLEALHILEQDRQDGLVDDDAYLASRRRHEQEAAEILARLDALAGDRGAAPPQGHISRQGRRDISHLRPRGWLLLAAMLTLCVAGAAAFLAEAVHLRAPGEVITGSVGQGGSPPFQQSSANLQAAEQAVFRHPHSYDALLKLGTAYLQNGRTAEADLSYQVAMQVDPARADAPTFHAMLLGASKRYEEGLRLLRRVERKHPAYARAWLIDGILSSRANGGKERAIGAWLRFLLLAPQSDLAPKVRRWIVQLEGKKG